MLRQLIERWVLSEEPSMPLYRLTSLTYSERIGHPKEWIVDPLTLGSVNLIVGMNASGKTRVINVINNLARMLLPDYSSRSLTGVYDVRYGAYDVDFRLDERFLRYVIEIENGRIVKEEVHEDGHRRLERGRGGEGLIFTELEGKAIRFKPPENELAAALRRDSLQHPFLEPLHEWAQSVRHFRFGSELGRNVASLFVEGGPEPNERDTWHVTGIFRKAVDALGVGFIDAVKQDMGSIGYDIEELGLFTSENMMAVQPPVPTGMVRLLGVRERGIDGIIEQVEMSQGMFRALSVLIQVNYSQMARRANCILIDDIGEGLDFDRSTRLIELLRRKAMKSSFQLIMATNDRFVMNHVPLEEWSILQRCGGHVRVRNYENSRDLFEDFKFTGLSNFSFLEMDFLNASQEVEAAIHE